MDDQDRCFDLGRREVRSFASPGWEASAINNDHPSIIGGDPCAKGDYNGPDDDYKGVIRGLGVAPTGNRAVGAAHLLAMLANWSPWQRQGGMGWVGFEPTSNRL